MLSVPVSAVSAGGAGGGGTGHNVLLCRDPATDRSLVAVVLSWKRTFAKFEVSQSQKRPQLVESAQDTMLNGYLNK